MVRPKPETPVGALLAGGRSSRMGSDKALVEVAGRTMAEHVAAALRTVCDRAVVVGRHDPVAGLDPVADPGPPHLGPLAGLVSALRVAGGRWVLLVAVDQPWVRPATLAGLAGRARDLPVVPVVGGIRQTTCALYPPDLIETAAEELAGGGSIQSVLDRSAFDPVVEAEWRSWGEDGRSWFSVDTAEEIAEGTVRYGPPQTGPA